MLTRKFLLKIINVNDCSYTSAHPVLVVGNGLLACTDLLTSIVTAFASKRELIDHDRSMSLKKETPSDIQLHLAALHGDENLLKKVLDSGKVHVDCKDEDDTTPLILASASGHLNCVVELLEQGANPNSRRVTGTTALFFASQGGFTDVVRILLKSGAVIDSPSLEGGTPLFVACQGGHVNIVKELLNRGANVHVAMKDRATALFIASQNGHRTILSMLLTEGANPDSCRNDGATPLWIASQMGHDHIARLLLQHGANIDAVRCDGATPIFKASHKGYSAVVHELLKYKPNLGLLPNGETALHAAAMFGHLPVVKQLIASGSEFRKNRDGLTPLDVAKQQNHWTIIEYLEEKMRESKARRSLENDLKNMK